MGPDNTSRECRGGRATMMTMRIRTIAMFAAVLALGACKRDGAATDGVAQTRTTSPAIAELLAGVPGNAVGLGFIDVAESPWSFAIGGGPFPLDESTRNALDKELREYVDRYLGLDLSR